MRQATLKIKMDTCDLRVLKNLCEFTLERNNGPNPLDKLVFIWKPGNSLEVKATDSYIAHRVRFGKIYKPEMYYSWKPPTSGRQEQRLDNHDDKYMAVVKADQLKLVLTQILKHKKSTIDSTCYLTYTTNESLDYYLEDGVIRPVDYETLHETGDYKQLYMMNFNFDFSDNSENYYNQFNVKPHIQVQDIRVDELIDKIWADEDLSIFEEAPEVLSMTAHVIMKACKVYDVNKIGKTDSRMNWKYMKNKWYIWQNYLSGANKHILRKDNVQSIETFVMTGRSYDEPKIGVI